MRTFLAVGAVLCASALMAAEIGKPSLVDTAKSGDKEAIKALVHKKADVNEAAADGTTALHWAAYHDDVASADVLLRAGAKVNATTDLGVTPLWLASQNGGAAMVKRLLDAGADPNLALTAGETPLMVAARGGYVDVVEQLLTKGANPNVHGSRGQTALMWAAAQKHPEVVKALIAHHADLNLKSDVWTDVMAVPPHGYLGYNKAIPHGGETGLMFAVRVGDMESAKLLLAAGANVNDADAWGVTAVTLAEHSGFTDMGLFLLEKGANPNSAANGFTALHEAIERRDDKMVAALLDHGADANTTLKTWTPTRRSSDDFNFDPALVGATPLWMAARFSEPNVMKLLLAHGADAKFVFHADWVAEQGFGQKERTEMTTILIAATGGGTGNPWVAAPRTQKEALTLEVAKLLADAGADLNATTDDGRTALDGAKQQRLTSVVTYLTEKGAKAGTGAAAGGGRGGRGRGNADAPAGR